MTYLLESVFSTTIQILFITILLKINLMEIKGLKDLLEMYNNTCELKKKAERRLKKFTERLSEEDKKNLGAIDEMNLLRL